jgi:ribosomal protein S18 acetylase RimI-like enzyme
MDPTLSLQPVAAADAPVLLAMARAFHAEDGHALDALGDSGVTAAAAGDPFLRIWFVMRGAERIGYAALTLGFSIQHGGRDAFIDDLYLVPAARGRGIGQVVMAMIEHEARLLGVQVLHLEVEIANSRAAALYAARGFEASPRRLMSKRLAE